MNRVELRDRFISDYALAITAPVVQQDIEDMWQAFIAKHFINGSITLNQLYRWNGAASHITVEYLAKRLHETEIHRKNREHHKAKYWKQHKETT